MTTKTFKCKDCHKCCKSKQGLQAHYTAKHDANCPHKCNKCGKRFGSSSNLKRHEKICVKKWKCNKCKQSFKFQFELCTHKINTHSSVKHDKAVGTVVKFSIIFEVIFK